MRGQLFLRQYDQKGKFVNSQNQLFFFQPSARGWKRKVSRYIVPEGIYRITLSFIFEKIQGTIYMDDFSFIRYKSMPSWNRILYKTFSSRAKTPLLIDGDVKKWEKIKKVSLNDISVVRKSGATGAITGAVPFDWRGKGDLSVEFATQWDENNLYLWVKVKDDIFCQPFTGSQGYKGDSVQIALAPNNSSESGDQDYSELTLMLNSGGKAEVYQSHGLPNPLALAAMKIGTMRDWKVIVKRDKTSQETLYEAAIPFLVLGPGFKPELGKSIGFSLLVNDNDGHGRRGWMQWSGGIGKHKAPNLYGSLIFKN